MKQNESDRIRNTDLQDSARDKERLKPDEVIMDLPEVKDIPGQEFIHPPALGELADTTISSDDEEGVGLFEDSDEDADLEMNTEKMPANDDARSNRISLDSTDNEGDPLNEKSAARTGSDLDTSGVDEDDLNESIGEEDEENNIYSLGDEKETDADNETLGNP